MRQSPLHQLVLNSSRRLALPIATYPGLALTGASVSDVVTDPDAQFRAQAALHERYRSPFVLSAMDLSVEAEAFGCALMMSDTEIPTVTGRLVTNIDQARALAVPEPGAARTGVALAAVQRLTNLSDKPLVIGGCIGPFSLAARLVGVSEAMELTMLEPELMHVLLDKSARFLAGYVAAFQAAGAVALIMAEPAAGLLSPKGMSEFSSAYVKSIALNCASARFTIVLHNCGARALHLPAIRETGLSAFHFGAPMDIPSALAQLPPDTLVCGNLDPAAVFVQSTPEQVRDRVDELLDVAALHSNFVLSSGCDIPPNAPLSSLDVLYDVLKRRS